VLLGERLGQVPSGPVADLIALLDGVPLALDLAAGSLRADDAPVLAQRLAGLLGEGRIGPTAAVVRWCWEACTDRERATLSQCTVFADAFGAPAVDRVVDLDPGPAPTVVLEGLARRRLLLRTGTRFRLHPEIRRHAGAALVTVGAFPGSGPNLARRTRARHAAWYAKERPVLPPWKDSGEDHPDLVLACERAIRDGNALVAVSTCLAVAAWVGDTGPAAALAERVLELSGLSAGSRGQLCALAAQGQTALGALGAALRQLAVARAGDGAGTAVARQRLSAEKEAATAAIAGLDGALAILEPAGNHLAAAEIALRRGDLQRLLRRSTEAGEDWRRAGALLRAGGHHGAMSAVLLRLGRWHQDRGELEPARAELERALAAASGPADVAAARLELGRLEHLCRRPATALEHLG
jgi:hypothetical protein